MRPYCLCYAVRHGGATVGGSGGPNVRAALPSGGAGGQALWRGAGPGCGAASLAGGIKAPYVNYLDATRLPPRNSSHACFLSFLLRHSFIAIADVLVRTSYREMAR